MHRIDADGNISNLFTDGDPAVPQVATQVDASWLNDVQEELCNFIEAQGITLVKGTQTQLAAALVAFLNSKLLGHTTQVLVNAPASSEAGAITGEGTGGPGLMGYATGTDAPCVRGRSNSGNDGPAIEGDARLGTGVGGRFYGNATRGCIGLVPLTTDPSAPVNGDIWLNSTTNLLKVRINGVTKTITVT